MSNHYDVVVIGGGMIGLSLATALSQADFSVAVIESNPPLLHWEENDYDSRVSAIHLGTYHFLKSLKQWSSIRASSYSPLERMEVWDAIGGGKISFDALDINQTVLGYIVENREIIRVLWEYCSASSAITLFTYKKAQALTDDYLELADGTQLTSDLVVGADGAHSWLRQQMQLEPNEKPYHHDALVAVVEVEKPHFCVAYQPFLSSGPLGVLPLSNPHQVAIVWSVDPARSEKLMHLTSDDFNRELSNALSYKLGKMQCLSERKKIPLSERHVKTYIQPNRVLVGDAAHTIHPLAGQGANLGFMDAACLASVLKEAKINRKNIGDYAVLRRYERWRKSENQLMLLAMSGFKSAFESASPVTVSLRSWGLNLTDQYESIKKYFMRIAVHPEFP